MIMPNTAKTLLACLSLLVFTQCSPPTAGVATSGNGASASVSSHSDGPCLPLVGFYPSWRHAAYPVANIDWKMVDGVATGFVIPRADGSLNKEGVDPYLAKLVADAHAHDDFVYVSIGGASGYGDAFQLISRDPKARARFVAEVSALVKAHGIDGIDLDWEYWTWQHKLNKGGRDPEESPLLGLLLKDLRAGLPKDVKLSADIFAGDWTGAQYNSDILAHVDHVNLMAYDFTGAWKESLVGHHSSVVMVGQAVDWARKNGFDLDKVWLGQPAYGIEFPDGKSMSARHLPQVKIAERLKDDPDALNRGRSDKLYFDTTNDSRRKASMAVMRGMSGVFFFEMTSDAPRPDQSLIAAARAGLGNRACPV